MKAKDHSPKLDRQLGLFDSSMMVIGIVIGSGIFMTTGLMAYALPSASLILIAWVLGGLQMLAGALTYAELGAAMPKAGGQYVYLREAYGSLPAFLFGWVAFIAYLTGTNAAIAVAVAEHLGSFYPSISTHNIVIGFDYFSISGGQIFAISLILILSFINYLGILFLSIVSTFLSFLIQFLIQSIVACLCFWTEKASSIERLLFIPTLFLSGLLAPVVSFPAYVKSWIYLTPFPYLIDFPANLLSGNETNISGGLSMQILWIFLLFPLFKKIWSEGTKKYTAMGS